LSIYGVRFEWRSRKANGGTLLENSFRLPLLLAELCRELEEQFEIVGTATNGQDAVDAILRLNPDIIVLDISMPLLNGIEASLLVRERQPRTKVLFMTVHESDEVYFGSFFCWSLWLCYKANNRK
jgi:CheY-like chemotaxis protein